MPDVTLPHPVIPVVAACRPALAPAMLHVLRWVGDLLDRGEDLPHGTLLAYTWWPLEVVRTDTLRLLAPPGWGPDRHDLSPVLGMLALQLDCARRLGADPVGFDPDDIVHVAPGALTAEAVMLKRLPDAPAGDAGWHVRPDGALQPYEDDYHEVALSEVFAERAALLIPMALPPGYLVRIHADRIVSVLDGAGTELWT